MNKEQLDSIYYGAVIALIHGQSTHADRLWRLAEKARMENNWEEIDRAFEFNRSYYVARK